ncbi:MAG: PilZ domain-containing protein [Desulfonatronovibrio sp.]
MDSDKRRRTRVSVKVPVIIFQDKTRVTSMTRNISLKGLLADPRPELIQDKPCTLNICLHSGITINLDAFVTMNTTRGAAFDFVKMDEDSFYHLHNLVKLHSKIPDQVDNELTRPAFDRELLDRFMKDKQEK